MLVSLLFYRQSPGWGKQVHLLGLWYVYRSVAGVLVSN